MTTSGATFISTGVGGLEVGADILGFDAGVLVVERIVCGEEGAGFERFGGAGSGGSEGHCCFSRSMASPARISIGGWL